MQPFKWTCPYCNHDTTITDKDFIRNECVLNIKNINGLLKAITYFIVCPNPDCNNVMLSCELRKTAFSTSPFSSGYWSDGELIKSYTLLPNSSAKVFPDYIPKQILDDYSEACLIKDLSPKASATLSRRCLQGMIRDFWKVNQKDLSHEINAIKDKVDPLTWEAIDAVRNIGNIGAHMEKDINLIIEVEPNEASSLIDLIEYLIKDWYINHHEREEKLKNIVSIKNVKNIEKSIVKETII